MKKLNGAVCVLVCLAALPSAARAAWVVPGGECVGVKLYAGAPVVVDTTAVTDINGREVDVAAAAGISRGDIITKVNGVAVETNEDLADIVSHSGGNPLELTIERNKETRTLTAAPAETPDGAKLGLWLRDSTAGLGTVTCFIDNRFAALGHGICDVDTGDIIPAGHGIIQGCSIQNITKSSDGAPGAITGDIDGTALGTITENTPRGLFGTADIVPDTAAVETAAIGEIRCADAAILADVDGGGVKEYTIEIKRVNRPWIGTKDMVIKVTDPELIEKTGGIVQGMSGAPILQNGKLVGAVTHVFVNDALSGYAISAEHMLQCLVGG